uniref:Sidoreflexin n=1 Tax=Timema douglasi TaxID=61478 RepID=A0A7R8VM96_TIMDO|nr:unnamed protein product [Timema douglasi]
MVDASRIDIDNTLWDQSTFLGRLKHFFWVTDPRTCIVSERSLDEAKILVEQYRIGKEPPGTTLQQVVYAKKLYESAFHPDTGEKQNVFGRMSFQVPGGMAITGAMLQFYRTMPAVVFWQWVNQSFNALVNYTNRNAKSSLTPTQLGVAYVSASASALVTAIGCKTFWQKHASPIYQRYVPFAAVAAANCANIPLMRQTELINGVDVFDDKGNKLTESRVAAVKGISQVVLSRIIMCAPGMTILPVIMQRLEQYPWMQRIHPLHGPIQVLLVGCFSLKVSTLAFLEPEQYNQLKEKCKGNVPTVVYFNKGL